MRADVVARVGGFTVTAAFAAEPGEVVALVGPNGAGKSTLLRALAGLVPATGTLVLRGSDVLALPPHRRGIGWVPQDRLLFAHLSAIDNAAFGLRATGLRKGAARRAAQGWLDRLGVADLASSKPSALSGGQAARVALARALAPAPSLVLLDEPLAALDVSTRDDVRRMLRATLSGGPAVTVLVTHDAVDAVTLADRIVVIEDGAVVQDATAAEVATAPRSAWAAGLLGQNAWRGTATADGLAVDSGGQVIAAEPLPVGTTALALAQPSAVVLHRSRPEGSARTVLFGPVSEVRALGGRVRVVVASAPPITAEVTVASAATLGLADGGAVWASLKATEVQLVAL